MSLATFFYGPISPTTHQVRDCCGKYHHLLLDRVGIGYQVHYRSSAMPPFGDHDPPAAASHSAPPPGLPPASPCRPVVGPLVAVPLFPAPEANPEMGLLPPLVNMIVRKIFQKIIPRKYPPRMDPGQKFSNQFAWGDNPEAAGSQIPLKKAFYTLLRRDQASTKGLVQSWGVLLLEVISAGKFGQVKGNVTAADFLMPAASGVGSFCKSSDIRTI